jgi:hypothetical protein
MVGISGQARLDVVAAANSIQALGKDGVESF